MSEKKVYTRAEKIEYYATKMAQYKMWYENAKKRLEYLTSDNYQEWDGQLSKELENKKKEGA